MTLDQGRLTTTDESGRRIYVYPAAVRGRFRDLRSRVYAGLVLFFLILPWLRIDGRQALLLNVATREFSIFGFFFHAHDAPLLIFFFLSFALLIALVTALWGRVWCGWACPQTVFIDGIFRRIDAFVEGNPRERRELDQAPLSVRKLFKKTLKWLLFLAVSLIITHSFLAYFVGAREVLHMVTRSPSENWASFLVIVFTTGIILFDFGWFREQFCTIMCPYGRFQSVLMDSHSLLVGYDKKRGEPRRGHVPPGETQGDCVNCLRCVQVCPTGIDIRNGTQMECIACTACVDACDEVMTKVKKPLGLIRYATEKEFSGSRSRQLRPRTIAYALLTMASVAAFAAALRHKEVLDVTVLRAKEMPYQFAQENVINHFQAEISNETNAVASVTFKIHDSAGGAELIMIPNPVTLEAHEMRRVNFFLRFPRSLLKNGAAKLMLDIESSALQKAKQEELPLVGPDR